METQKQKHPHQPVLLPAVLKLLAPESGDRYLDLTAGYGGHAEAILQRTKNWKQSVLVDRDQMAIDYLNNRFNEHSLTIMHSDYVAAIQSLRAAKPRSTFNLMLLDVGVSSLQLDRAERGFSFRYDAPLDMRMDQRQELTASDVVNEWSLDELVRIIREYGEDPQAERIAQAIISQRPLETTQQLADVVSSTIRRAGQRIHPATRTFQAVRIAVNHELSQLEQAVELAPDLLTPGGRLAVISFHSLEDRIVKQAFKKRSHGFEADVKLLTPQPVTADDNSSNPRARSAKLRAVVKIKQKGKEATNAN